MDGIPGPKTYNAARNVRKGAKGNLTRVLQALLYMAGQNPGPFDGHFGDGTEKAVRAFQKAKGLTVDGIAGKNTWKALL
ncbi:peptidoglycan-binding domain-containing protein [Shouchella clausii]|nr:peptidoglycan-binding domain-containing protein [Shouchella clausii]MDO7281751.1 peptidoglycan-binding domain-containing protein [Shouchella clausii]MDO7301846.1 peptidoglycan-binding domain-containing protein [Shouchella clausii]